MQLACIVMHMTISVAVAGASGYAGGELLRLLPRPPRRRDRRPDRRLQRRRDRSAALQPHLVPLADRVLGRPRRRDAGRARRRLPRPAARPVGELAAALGDDAVVIDCGADFRLTDQAAWEQFYGGDARRLLALRTPRARRPARAPRGRDAGSPCPAATRPSPRSRSPPPSPPASSTPDIVVVAASGTSGAGKAAKPTCSAARSWATPAPTASAASTGTRPRSCRTSRRSTDADVRVSFTPLLVPMRRGILATCSAPLAGDVDAGGCARPTRRPTATSRSCTCCPRASGRRPSPCIGSNAVHLQVTVDEAARPAGRGRRRRQPHQGHRRRRRAVHEPRARPPRDHGPHDDRTRTVSDRPTDDRPADQATATDRPTFALVQYPEQLAVVRLGPGADVPAWAEPSAPFSITATATETSVVLRLRACRARPPQARAVHGLRGARARSTSR